MVIQAEQGGGHMLLGLGAAVLVVAAVVTASWPAGSAARRAPMADSAGQVTLPAGSLTHVLVSDDGELLVAGGADGSLGLWRLPGRTLIRHEQATGAPVTLLLTSPDGLLLAGDTSGKLRGWQLPELTVEPLESPNVAVTCAAFRLHKGQRQIVFGLSDGRRIGVGADGTQVRKSGHRAVSVATFDPQRDLLITCGHEGDLRWNDAGTGELRAKLTRHQTAVSALAWSPDGKRLISGDWNGLILLTDAAKQQVVSDASQPDAVASLVWRGNHIISGSWDGNIRIWQGSDDGLDLAATIDTGRPIHALAVDPQGKTAFTVHGGPDVELWSLPQFIESGNRSLP